MGRVWRFELTLVVFLFLVLLLYKMFAYTGRAVFIFLYGRTDGWTDGPGWRFVSFRMVCLKYVCFPFKNSVSGGLGWLVTWRLEWIRR